jgi:ankyrin repeat protein
LIGRGYDRDIEAYCGQKPIKGYENYFPYLVEDTLNKLGWTLLHVAVYRGQVERVAQLLQEGKIKVNEPGRNGKTALHLAAEGGHLEIANMLLDAGASLTLKDGKGKISVQRALEEGHLELIRLLIRRGSPIPDPFVATVVGRLDLLNGFLKSDRKGVDQKTPYGQTLLHLAAWFGQTRAVSALLAQGAKVDEYTCDFPTELWPNNIFGVTALDIASALGHEEIVRELIRFGSSIRETNGSEDPFQYITTLAPLHRVARYGHTRVAKLYLDAKVPLSVKVAETGQTPLHLAACWGHGDMTELFLKHGADVHAADEMGRTPLHAAVESGDERVVHLLLKHGAKVTTRDELKLTPLDLARRIKEVSLAKILEKP